MLERRHIIAIDDTPSIRTFLRISLEDQGAEFHEAGSAQEGLDLCRKLHPDIVVLDLGLPDRDGLDILAEIKTMHNGHSPAVVVLTVRKEAETKQIALERGADAYLTKPFMMEDLLEVLCEEADRRTVS